MVTKILSDSNKKLLGRCDWIRGILTGTKKENCANTHKVGVSAQ